MQLDSVVLVVGTQLNVPVPGNTRLVGFSSTVQGFGLGTGPCVATLRFSDALDFIIE